MKKFTHLIFLFLLILLFFGCPANAKDQVVGEIININYKYKIAFTDLNNYHLQPGDIVEIYKDNAFLTYLEVSESSSAISKMIPLKSKGEYDTNVNFSEIRIGNKVLKVEEDKLKSPQRIKALAAIKGQETEETPSGLKSIKISEVDVPEDTKETIIQKYNALLEKHTDIVKSLITIKAEKRLLKSNNELLTNEVMLAQEETKTLKMKILRLEGQIVKLKENSNDDTCQKQLDESIETINLLKDKLRKIQKYIEGKK